jgi:hypothetical protein
MREEARAQVGRTEAEPSREREHSNVGATSGALARHYTRNAADGYSHQHDALQFARMVFSFRYERAILARTLIAFGEQWPCAPAHDAAHGGHHGAG